MAPADSSDLDRHLSVLLVCLDSGGSLFLPPESAVYKSCNVLDTGSLTEPDQSELVVYAGRDSAKIEHR